jgi:uncharacterized membrane protein YhhN
VRSPLVRRARSVTLRLILLFSIAVLATAIAVAALLCAERGHERIGVAIAKPVASCGFLAAAWAAGAPGSSYGRTLLAGLVLCFLGDLLLISSHRASFLAGLVSFLLGHLAFALACVVRGVVLPAALFSTFVLVPLAIGVWRWLGPHVDARMRIPVLAYITVITLMVALALGSVEFRASFALAAGAIAFFLSDISVARDRFIAPGFVNRAWGLPLYYGAVLLLAASTASAHG